MLELMAEHVAAAAAPHADEGHRLDDVGRQGESAERLLEIVHASRSSYDT